MNNFFTIEDTDNVLHHVNRNLVSEVAECDGYCVVYACGHPIKTTSTCKGIIDDANWSVATSNS